MTTAARIITGVVRLRLLLIGLLVGITGLALVARFKWVSTIRGDLVSRR